MRTEPINDLDQRYMEWRDRNPTVYGLFQTFASDLRRQNKRFGIGLLTERVRWEIYFNKDEAEDFKINNNYRAYLVRDLIQEMPELESLVSLRTVARET